MKIPKKLETKRILLRELKASDAKDIVRNANNLEVSKNLATLPYPYKLKDARGWIKKCSKKTKEKLRNDYTFAIELKSERKFIGAIGLHKIDKFQGTAEMGYWLGQNYWRQGIMYEAAKKVLDFAFRNLKLRRINISAFSANQASNCLIKKLGFKYEGMRRKNIRSKADGKIHNQNIYGLLKDEWKK
ncbi:MAG: GNAT family N-acetyltransferase [Candidatus Pacearchaeota archaeon]